MNQHSWGFNGICDNCGIEQRAIVMNRAAIECFGSPNSWILKKSGEGFKAGEPSAPPMVFDDFAVAPKCLQPPPPPGGARAMVNLLELARDNMEIMQGKRCPHCRLKWADDGSNVDCCEAMRAEIKKIEFHFWGRPVSVGDMPFITKSFALHNKLVGPPATVTDDEVKPDAIVG